MKYLVNRETKEHRIYEDADGNKHYLPAEERPNNDDWMFVEADAEGWIKWDGGECPLPDNCLCHYNMVNGSWPRPCAARFLRWDRAGSEGDIIAYRPILDNPVVKESLTAPAPDYDPRSVSFNLLKRLEAAHEAAQSIPELEAELREVLGSMGYDLVARNPFVEPESATETPQDMSDWRNWREGDVVEAARNHNDGLTSGETYKYRTSGISGYVGIKSDDTGEPNSYPPDYFRFHSRPEKTE
jgi:hypothetical protein